MELAVRTGENNFWNFVSKVYNLQPSCTEQPSFTKTCSQKTPKVQSKHKKGSKGGQGSPKLPCLSFLLAKQFLDQLDQLHVVSTAETLKGLVHLALEFQQKVHRNTEYNFIIHRVGPALLIDSLQDTTTPVSQTTQKQKKSRKSSKSGSYSPFASTHEYEDFFAEMYEFYLNISNDKEIQADPEKTEKIESILRKLALPVSRPSSSHDLRRMPSSPRTRCFSDGLGQNNASSTVLHASKNCFLNNSRWTFQNLQMLTGSNLKIFGDGETPAVSITLAQNEQPINILTGVDCWLDNLICEIPEVVMFFHDNGFIKSFEKLPTDQIPRISNFEPNIVKDLATNIVSYLRRNCTQQGHTYWMYKAAGDDIVKLYDLTSISRLQEGTKSGWSASNPYTIAVAELLYALSLRKYQSIWKPPKANEHEPYFMMNTGTSDGDEASYRQRVFSETRQLLTNCLLLLENNGHGNHAIYADAMALMGDLFAREFFTSERQVSSKAVIVSDKLQSKNVQNYCQQMHLSEMAGNAAQDQIFPNNGGIMDTVDEGNRTDLESILSQEPLKNIPSAKTVLYYYQYIQKLKIKAVPYEPGTDQTTEIEPNFENTILLKALLLLYDDSISGRSMENAIYIMQIALKLITDESTRKQFLYTRYADALLLQGQIYEKLEFSDKFTWAPLFPDYEYLGGLYDVQFIGKTRVLTLYKEAKDYYMLCGDSEKVALMCKKMTSHYLEPKHSTGDELTDMKSYIREIGDKNLYKVASIIEEGIRCVKDDKKKSPKMARFVCMLYCDLAKLARIASHIQNEDKEKMRGVPVKKWLRYAKSTYLNILDMEETLMKLDASETPNGETILSNTCYDICNVCMELNEFRFAVKYTKYVTCPKKLAVICFKLFIQHPQHYTEMMSHRKSELPDEVKQAVVAQCRKHFTFLINVPDCKEFVKPLFLKFFKEIQKPNYSLREVFWIVRELMMGTSPQADIRRVDAALERREFEDHVDAFTRQVEDYAVMRIDNQGKRFGIHSEDPAEKEAALLDENVIP